MHDHDSSLLQIRGTWMYRMTMVVLIFEIEPVPKIFESHHCIHPLHLDIYFFIVLFNDPNSTYPETSFVIPNSTSLVVTGCAFTVLNVT